MFTYYKTLINILRRKKSNSHRTKNIMRSRKERQHVVFLEASKKGSKDSRQGPLLILWLMISLSPEPIFWCLSVTTTCRFAFQNISIFFVYLGEENHGSERTCAIDHRTRFLIFQRYVLTAANNYYYSQSEDRDPFFRCHYSAWLRVYGSGVQQARCIKSINSIKVISGRDTSELYLQ